MLAEPVALGGELLQMAVGFFPMVIELLVVRFALAEAHHLDVAHETLDGAVGQLGDEGEQTVGGGIVHAHQMDKGDMVECFRP